MAAALLPPCSPSLSDEEEEEETTRRRLLRPGCAVLAGAAGRAGCLPLAAADSGASTSLPARASLRRRRVGCSCSPSLPPELPGCCRCCCWLPSPAAAPEPPTSGASAAGSVAAAAGAFSASAACKLSSSPCRACCAACSARRAACCCWQRRVTLSCRLHTPTKGRAALTHTHAWPPCLPAAGSRARAHHAPTYPPSREPFPPKQPPT